jgi:hypothetical protein
LSKTFYAQQLLIADDLLTDGIAGIQAGAILYHPIFFSICSEYSVFQRLMIPVHRNLITIG